MGNTLARSRILRLIRNSGHPITYASLKEKMDGFCSRVTVYRILLRMEKDKLIHRFPDHNGDFRYYACDENPTYEHSHFQCTECNALFDLKTEQLGSFVPKGYLVRSINFLASGICPECGSKN